MLILSLGGLATACGTATESTTPEATPSTALQPITRGASLGADGQTITTVIPVGGCQRGKLTGAETARVITLALSLTTHEKANEVCAANVKLVPVSFKLRSPLDHRKAVDKATGKPVIIRKPQG
jgi:hypothetical protein